MTYFLLLLILALSSPAFATSPDLEPQISKLEFQDVHFGDFPSVKMLCIRGLCPVGTRGVGINTNSLIPLTYTKEMAITNCNRVKISTPEYSYSDDKMFQIQFRLECDPQAQQECIDAVKRGLDAEYGLTLLEASAKDRQVPPTALEAFKTESGSVILMIWNTDGKRGSFPLVKIYDETLMDIARKSINPDYVPFKKENLENQKADKS